MGEPVEQPASWTTRVVVNVAPDGMRATVDLKTVSEGQSPKSLSEAIRAALTEAGVVKGIDDDAVYTAAAMNLTRNEPVYGFSVAQGLAAVEAGNARIAFRFQLGGKDPSVVAQEREAGDFDEKTLAKPCVRAGDTLAVIEPGQPGTDGYTVMGATLMARPPSAAALKTGAGVELTDDARTYAVAPDTIGYANYIDGTLLVEPPVTVSQDAMEARLAVHPDATFTLAEIERWLESHGIVHGVRRDAIAVALAKASEIDAPIEAIAAVGTAPTPGEDARIDYHFHRQPLAGWISDADTHIDYHERGFLQQVQQGDLLAQKIPATPGSPGRNIYGLEIPPVPGRDIALAAAGEAALSGDGLECRAAADGVIVAADAGTVGVFQEFNVSGDVDFHTGNLDMKGVLLVTGWIRSGFRVHATGDLFVGGGVEPAIIETDANLNVALGIVGNDQSHAASKGNLAADFIENARVQAGGDILVRDGILNSQVTAEGRVDTTAGKGYIIGGTLRAAKGVAVNELGSRGGVRTVVDVGLDTAARVKLAEMERECALFERNQQKIAKSVAAFVQRSKSRKPQPAEVQALARLAHFRRDAELKRRDIATFWKRVEGTPATVKVHRAVHDGVVVFVMGRRMDVQQDTFGPGEFVFDNGSGQVAFRT